MPIKGRPLGIWIVCALLLVAAAAISYLAVPSGRAGLVAAIAFGLAGLFIIGLLFRVTWLYFALLLFLSLSILLQLVAMTLILTAYIAAEAFDWLQLIARYWQGAVVMMVVVGVISYMSRASVREYYSPRQSDN